MIVCWLFLDPPVTAVDSGKKAMELLGRRRGDRDHLTPSSPAAAAAANVRHPSPYTALQMSHLIFHHLI
jgi:hypothetical protein